MNQYPSDVLHSTQQISNISYKEYVKEKGFILLSLSNISKRLSILKTGNTLRLGDSSFNLRGYSVKGLISLIHEYAPDVEIKVNSTVDINLLSHISALFVADFNTTKLVTRPLVTSPIPKSWINTYIDENTLSEYDLVSFDVFSLYSRKPQEVKEVSDSYHLPSTTSESEVFCRYHANTLNVYCLHEIPTQDIGIQGLASLGGYE